MGTGNKRLSKRFVNKRWIGEEMSMNMEEKKTKQMMRLNPVFSFFKLFGRGMDVDVHSLLFSIFARLIPD